jgi:Protein of unknown function (DUF3501)
MTTAPARTVLSRADILSMEDYARIRADKRREMVAVKKNRRVSVGPSATFHFESYDTMWLQIHEMLRIEKGGEEQIAGELHAYNPLIPKGDELVATLMFEIDDPVRRANLLNRLGGVENTIVLQFDGETVSAEPERDVERTSEAGKASSVHFLHFTLRPGQIAKFRKEGMQVILGIGHEQYGHMAILPEAVRGELAKDFYPSL